MPACDHLLLRLAARFWFDAVETPATSATRRKGTLLLSLHRNGAVDGLALLDAASNPAFLLSTQWRKGLLALLFRRDLFVTRDKDTGDRTQNRAALDACAQRLHRGESVILFPEGTSTLGPRRLPVKSGAAHLIASLLEQKTPVRVIPIAPCYENPVAFRSRVSFVVGAPMPLDDLHALSPLDALRTLKRRVDEALDAVGYRFDSDEAQREAEYLALVATLENSGNYAQNLHHFAQAAHSALYEERQRLEAVFGTRPPFRFGGVPVFPRLPLPLHLLPTLAYGSFALAGAFVNLPPLLAGYGAGKRFPDDRNVVALWKLLGGFPAFLLWASGVTLLSAIMSAPELFALWGVLSLAGLCCWRKARLFAVGLGNALRFPHAASLYRAFASHVAACAHERSRP